MIFYNVKCTKHSAVPFYKISVVFYKKSIFVHSMPF